MPRRWKPPTSCTLCFNRTIRMRPVAFDVSAGRRIVRFSPVPAAVCLQCGLRSFDPRVLAQLHRRSRAVRGSGRILLAKV